MIRNIAAMIVCLCCIATSGAFSILGMHSGLILGPVWAVFGCALVAIAAFAAVSTGRGTTIAVAAAAVCALAFAANKIVWGRRSVVTVIRHASEKE